MTCIFEEIERDGGQWCSRRAARATFSIESVKALPVGDLDIVIVTKDGDRRCSIGAKDRSRLFR